MPWTQPLENLQRTVRQLIWLSVIVMTIFALISITAIGISAYVMYQRSQDNKANIRRNEQTILALCRQINTHNSDLLIVALDQGIPFYKLQFLLPKDCNPAKLRQKNGVPE